MPFGTGTFFSRRLPQLPQRARQPFPDALDVNRGRHGYARHSPISRQNIADYFPFDIGEPTLDAVVLEAELFEVKAE